MNIALSAVIISILLIPPVVFYLSVYIGRYPRAIPKFSLFEGILASAVISLLIHSAAMSLVSYEIRFDILIKLLGGDLKNIENTIGNPALKSAVSTFAIYNLALLSIMVLLGRITRKLLKVTGLHTRNDIFNLYNKWWYFFNGHYADVDDFDLVYIDAVVDTHDGTIIYSGFLVNFETRGNELDRIYLQDTVRREFKRHAPKGDLLLNEAGDPVEIPTSTFSLKYENVVNLSVNFLVIEEKEG